LFSKSFKKIGEKIGVNGESVLGIFTSSVNAIPTFSMAEKMDDKGVIMNVAFIVCGAYVFGDHLAFQATVDTTTVFPTVVAKICGGLLAIILTLIFTKKEYNRK
jgi:ethanolamine transporter